MPRNELRHRQHVARLWAAALQVAILEMGRGDLQRMPDPLAGRKTAPAVRRVCRRMLAAVHEDRPIERAHVLKAVADDLARDRIEVFENAGAADAAPLVRRRVRPALVLGGAPDRFRRRIGAQTAGFVERNTEIVGQRRLARVLGVVDPPFPGDIRCAPPATELSQTRRLTMTARPISASPTVRSRFRVGIPPWRFAGRIDAGIMGRMAPACRPADEARARDRFLSASRTMQMCMTVLRRLDFPSEAECNTPASGFGGGKPADALRFGG